jgi:DNA-binding protein HU-beta
MNRGQLIDELADRTGLTRPEADAVVRALFEPGTGIISSELSGGGSVALSGFGSFTTRARPARKGRNPRTGREIEIPARRACVFRPRKGLRSSMKDMVGA